MNPSRRNLIAMGGGAVAGLVFTPIPWKLLDDTSIWTQNWPWIPQPPRGAVETKAAVCGLCPNGCSLRVRMAANCPIGISSAPGSAVCPLAFGAHQLNWHPGRLKEVRHRGRTATWDDATAAFRKACAEGRIAIFDGQPRRAASAILRDFAKTHGSYTVVPTMEERALVPYAEWSGVPAAELGYDLESARTIVSFGAPLLDGWGAPGRFAKIWSARAAGTGDPELRLIQVESSLSRTASLSWRWVPNRLGSDAALAAGIARVLLEEHLVPAKGPMPSISVADAALEAGMPTDALVELAHTIASRLPAIALSYDEQPAVAALNLVLGGSIVQRRENGASEKPSSTPRAVLLDATVPWDVNPYPAVETFRFAAWDGGNSGVEWLLPAPGFLEELTDHPSAPASAVASYRLSPALLTPPAGAMSAAAFVGGNLEEAVRARCEQIAHGAGAKLQEELLAGGAWQDEPKFSRKLHCELHGWPTATSIPRHANWIAAWSAPVLPPLASKLYQESNLRETPNRSLL